MFVLQRWEKMGRQVCGALTQRQAVWCYLWRSVQWNLCWTTQVLRVLVSVQLPVLSKGCFPTCPDHWLGSAGMGPLCETLPSHLPGEFLQQPAPGCCISAMIVQQQLLHIDQTTSKLNLVWMLSPFGDANQREHGKLSWPGKPFQKQPFDPKQKANRDTACAFKCLQITREINSF